MDIFELFETKYENIHNKVQIILVYGKVNLKLSIIIMKSYSHQIDEIAADLSNSFGT